MKNEFTKTAQFMYEKAVAEEIYPEELEGESLAIHNMLAEIRELGYPYYYFADIEYRHINNCSVMEVMLKYYPQMESVITKNNLLRKINPNKFPVIRQLALKEYNDLSPLSKMSITGFEEVLARGKLNRADIELLLKLMDIPDNYASSSSIRQALLKAVPAEFRQTSLRYSQGVLLPIVLEDYFKYADSQAMQCLKNASQITEEEVCLLHRNKSYSLSVTMYEYYKRLCTKENIEKEARKYLKKLSVISD